MGLEMVVQVVKWEWIFEMDVVEVLFMQNHMLLEISHHYHG